MERKSYSKSNAFSFSPSNVKILRNERLYVNVLLKTGSCVFPVLKFEKKK